MKTFERPEDEIALGKALWYRVTNDTYSDEEKAEQDAKLLEYLQRYVVEPINPKDTLKFLTIKKEYDNCNVFTGHPTFSINTHMVLNGQTGKNNWFYIKLLLFIISYVVAYYMYTPLVTFAIDLASQWHYSMYTNDISNWLARLVDLEHIQPFMLRNRPYFFGVFAAFHTIAMTPMAVICLPLLFLAVTNNDYRSCVTDNMGQPVCFEDTDDINRNKITTYCTQTRGLIESFRLSLIADWYIKEVLHLEQVPITEVDKFNNLRFDSKAIHHSIHDKDIQFLNPKGGYFRNDNY